MTLATKKTLYEQDFALWIDKTVQQLKSGKIKNLYFSINR